MAEKHRRRPHRLPEYDYTQPGAYFITIVTYHRACLFGEIKNGEMVLNAMGNIVLREWRRLSSRFPNIELDEFVIMPNHLHGIIMIVDRLTRPAVGYSPDGRGTGDLSRNFVLGESPVPLPGMPSAPFPATPPVLPAMGDSPTRPAVEDSSTRPAMGDSTTRRGTGDLSPWASI